MTIDKKKIYMNTENRTLFQTTRFCVLVFVIGACCLGCEREYDSIILDAGIFEDSIKVFITAERPALVIVEYRSEAGGCRGHYDTQVSWMGTNTYHIHARQSDIHPDDPSFCTDDVYEYTEQIILGYLDPGHYIVSVNGLVKQFEVTPEPECQTI